MESWRKIQLLDGVYTDWFAGQVQHGCMVKWMVIDDVLNAFRATICYILWLCDHQSWLEWSWNRPSYVFIYIYRWYVCIISYFYIYMYILHILWYMIYRYISVLYSTIRSVCELPVFGYPWKSLALRGSTSIDFFFMAILVAPSGFSFSSGIMLPKHPKTKSGL